MEDVGVKWSQFKELHAPKPKVPAKKVATGIIVPVKSPVAERGLSEYELMRLEKIKRNNAYLER